jgi:hypothetical protein
MMVGLGFELGAQSSEPRGGFIQKNALAWENNASFSRTDFDFAVILGQTRLCVASAL